MIETTNKDKYLGIVMDNRLTFEDHINEKINKANQVLGISRRFSVHLYAENSKYLYKTTVRTLLEYENRVWSPYRKKDITSIDNVRRRVIKLLPGLK